MKTLRFLLIGLTVIGLAAAARTQAASPNLGDLIKSASQPDVYYYGMNGKRYVFPNEKTFFSWYASFDTKTLTDEELATIPVGGAVTYKPGNRMIKITTDPKVFAVAQGGVLRWVKTEALAAELYGADWAAKVHDLPDEYFATYKIGAEINNASDYSPSFETSAVTSIAADKGLVTSTPAEPPTPVTPTSTSAVTLSVSKSPAVAGDTETLLAEASHPSGIKKIELFFDGTLIKSCQTAACSGETSVPLSGTKSNYEVKAIATAVNETQLTKTVTVPIDSSASSSVKLTIGKSTIRQGQLAEVIADLDTSLAAIRTDIYVDGYSKKACASGIRQCRWSDYLTGEVGSVHEVYGKITDNIGRLFYSVKKTITIGTNDTPSVTIAEDKASILKGETVGLTVTAGDDDAIARIEILKGEEVVKTCQNTSSCSAVTGPWNELGFLAFSGRATDSLGATSTSETVTITVK